MKKRASVLTISLIGAGVSIVLGFTVPLFGVLISAAVLAWLIFIERPWTKREDRPLRVILTCLSAIVFLGTLVLLLTVIPQAPNQTEIVTPSSPTPSPAN